MKIAILSDSHDNVANLDKIIAWLNKEGIKIMIHAGDVAAPGVLKKVIAPQFLGQIHLIFGNVGDRELLEKVAGEFSNVKYYGDQGEIEVGGQKIAFVHFPDVVEDLAHEGRFDVVISGHNHQAEIKKFLNTLMINPGTSGGLFAPATFAVYDTETREGEIKNIDSI